MPEESTMEVLIFSLDAVVLALQELDLIIAPFGPHLLQPWVWF